jgi:hypothetical protein
MQGFEYPTKPHIRRHAPDGYGNYESYRDWLRDEFMFRCVYCLDREQWNGRDAAFHIDHFIPVAVNEDGKLEYDNLLYACASCNTAKSSILGLPDPCSVSLADCVCIKDNGKIEALNRTGDLLIKTLRFDSPQKVQWRYRWIRTLTALRIQDPMLYREYMAFPDDLPDLRIKNAPQNSKPRSVDDCFLAQRERGELPEVY